jgi:hypothetical protein
MRGEERRSATVRFRCRLDQGHLKTPGSHRFSVPGRAVEQGEAVPVGTGAWQTASLSESILSALMNASTFALISAPAAVAAPANQRFT